MEHIITVLTSNKILLAGAVIISILIVLSVWKKLAMAALVLIALLVIYIGYLTYSGQKVPKTKQEVMEYGAQKIDAIKKEGSETIRRINK